MKLISLNAWGGEVYKPLMEFVARRAVTTDIFCFQELYFSKAPFARAFGVEANLARELKNLLTDFRVVERLADGDAWIRGVDLDHDIRMGQAIFVKKSIDVLQSGGFHTYTQDAESVKERNELVTGNFQFANIRNAGEHYVIGNIHGVWLPGTKSDTPKRIEQAENLKNFLSQHLGKVVLCGDFNLQPETQSIAIIGSDMRNLITEYGVKTTRNKNYKDMEKYRDYIADYAFVSPDVNVADFKVLQDEVSDHLPLFLEFS